MSTLTDTPRPGRPGLVGPAILIGLGGVLLLNNLGLLGWSVWDTLLRLWPLLLIALGLELMVGRRSTAARLLIPLALLSILGASIWWASTQAASGAGLEITAIQQPLDGASRAEVMLAVGVGELRLAAMDDPAGLIAGTVRARPGALLGPTATVRDGVAFYTLRQRGEASLPWGAQTVGGRWDLRLSPQVPLRLTLDTGAGTTSANLSDLRVSELTVNSGVGTIDLTLPRAAQLRGTINGGVGQTTISIPQGVAARLTFHRGLGDVQVPDTYVRQGDVYESAGYAAADQRVELTINGGVGGITIRTGG
jgi:hypothetical protein